VPASLPASATGGTAHTCALLHCCPPLHVLQVAPPVPQAVSAVPPTHWPSEQQPLAHVSGPQVLEVGPPHADKARASRALEVRERRRSSTETSFRVRP
jgi:hypothetical protein